MQLTFSRYFRVHSWKPNTHTSSTYTARKCCILAMSQYYLV